jgi:hypothetical protein
VRRVNRSTKYVEDIARDRHDAVGRSVYDPRVTPATPTSEPLAAKPA